MNDHNPHNEEHSRFFKETHILYNRSKEDVWKDMMAQIKDREKTVNKRKTIRMSWALAAVLLFLIGLTAIMRFYTATFYAPPGQHASRTLRNGSKVHLNAGTELSYHPWWWQFARILELKGEAYFEVEKGSRFIVKSSHGKTEVLGTSFNVYARDDEYRVHCLTGEVLVATKAGEKKVLKPNQAVSVSDEGNMEYQTNVKSQHAIAWTKNRFIFTAVPLEQVLREMERQFDITIETATGFEGEYTGNFRRGSSPETLLKMIVRPFGLEVQQIHQTKYRITKGED
jgi:ferric-dicitrate binding protein FerR (iron transport regulator)